MNKIRILVAEDHKLVRETWTSILNMDQRFQVIAACDNTEKAISIVQQEHPDIVLMDVSILPLDGFKATAQICQISPDTKVIGLSFHTEMVTVQKMFAAGAIGYLTKNSGCAELTEAIMRVNGGNKYVCSEIREKGFDVVGLSQVRDPSTISLTNKEIQVSHFIKDGFRSKEIAEELDISVRTVSAHRYNIFKKLNIKSSISLISVLNQIPGYVKYAENRPPR
jgi:DNA-binding NarL/FixJ family response regulator